MSVIQIGADLVSADWYESPATVLASAKARAQKLSQSAGSKATVTELPMFGPDAFELFYLNTSYKLVAADSSDRPSTQSVIQAACTVVIRDSKNHPASMNVAIASDHGMTKDTTQAHTCGLAQAVAEKFMS